MFSFNAGSNIVTVTNAIDDRLSIVESIIIDLDSIFPHTNLNTLNFKDDNGDQIINIDYVPIVNEQLAVVLLKKDINYVKKEQGDVDYWDEVVVTNNLNDISPIGYQCNIATEFEGKTRVEIFLLDTFTITRETAIKRQFDIDSTYVIRVDFEKLGVVGGTSVDIQFITKSRSEQLLQDNVVQNNLNVLYKLHNMLDLRNIDTIRDNSNSKFDYVFNSTSSNTLVPYKVSKIMEDLLIQEMLPDFVTFFKSLELDIEQNVNTIAEQDERYEKLRKVKYALLKNAQIINSGVRGSLEGMRLVYDLYVQNLSAYYYVSIESSPIGKNFVYRVTSSLPKHIWTTIIRPIVHPVSWFDDFIYIDIQDSTSNSNIPEGNVVANSKIYQRTSQLEQVPLSFLDFNNRCKGYNTRYNSYNLSSFGNLETSYKFSFTECEYYAKMYTGDVYKFKDTANATVYNLNIINGNLYLTTVDPDVGVTHDEYLNLYSDRAGIADFQITVTDGILSITTGIVRTTEEENNYFIGSDGYKTYVLDTDGSYLYIKSLPLEVEISPVVLPINTIDTIAINDNLGNTYNITVTDEIISLTDIPNVSAPTTIDVFTVMGASFRLSIVDGSLKMELISRTNESENNIIKDTTGKGYRLAVDPYRLELYLLTI